VVGQAAYKAASPTLIITHELKTLVNSAYREKKDTLLSGVSQADKRHINGAFFG
jgi:hypothetical protein